MVNERASKINDQINVMGLDLSALSELEVTSSVAAHEHDFTQLTMVEQEATDTGNGNQPSGANA